MTAFIAKQMLGNQLDSVKGSVSYMFLQIYYTKLKGFKSIVSKVLSIFKQRILGKMKYFVLKFFKIRIVQLYLKNKSK